MSISVLHVDDNSDLLEMTATFLEREDARFDIKKVTSAKNALKIINRNGFECIVSDFEMPHQNGIEFLRKVRSEHPDLPFILFTGKGSEEIASDAITAGATDYIQKETGTEHYQLLANRIGHAVEKYRSETAIERTEERYHNLVDTAPIPILLFGPDGKSVYANNAAVEFMNAESYNEIENEPFAKFLKGGDKNTAQERFDKLMNDGTGVPEIEYTVRAVDGEIKEATVATAYGYYKGERVAQAMIHH